MYRRRDKNRLIKIKYSQNYIGNRRRILVQISSCYLRRLLIEIMYWKAGKKGGFLTEPNILVQKNVLDI